MNKKIIIIFSFVGIFVVSIIFYNILDLGNNNKGKKQNLEISSKNEKLVIDKEGVYSIEDATSLYLNLNNLFSEEEIENLGFLNHIDVKKEYPDISGMKLIYQSMTDADILYGSKRATYPVGYGAGKRYMTTDYSLEGSTKTTGENERVTCRFSLSQYENEDDMKKYNVFPEELKKLYSIEKDNIGNDSIKLENKDFEVKYSSDGIEGNSKVTDDLIKVNVKSENEDILSYEIYKSKIRNFKVGNYYVSSLDCFGSKENSENIAIKLSILLESKLKNLPPVVHGENENVFIRNKDDLESNYNYSNILKKEDVSSSFNYPFEFEIDEDNYYDNFYPSYKYVTKMNTEENKGGFCVTSITVFNEKMKMMDSFREYVIKRKKEHDEIKKISLFGEESYLKMSKFINYEITVYFRKYNDMVKVYCKSPKELNYALLKKRVFSIAKVIEKNLIK